MSGCSTGCQKCTCAFGRPSYCQGGAKLQQLLSFALTAQPVKFTEVLPSGIVSSWTCVCVCASVQVCQSLFEYGNVIVAWELPHVWMLRYAGL
mmetsp:Transcript_27295/g.73774  ORF Transcript_27295/g.73774 Transcript_27295/m.73774 type:complete len:93 (+) Transcript_27295:1707-1985(+)